MDTMDGCFFTCFVTLSVGKGVPSQKGIHFEGHEVEEVASTAMACSYFLQFLSESGSFFLGYIIPGVSERFCLELGWMRFNSWNRYDKAILWGFGKREDDVGGRELLLFQVSFNHFNLSDASCSHLTHHKKRERKKKKEKRRAADADRLKHLRCGDSGGDGELTWHDGVRDVEVVQGQAQGLTWGGRGRAGGFGGWPGRFDGRGSRRGVAAGLEPIVLGFECLNLILCVGKRLKKKKEGVSEKVQVGLGSRERFHCLG